MTLVEVLVAVAVASLLLLAIVSLSAFSSRSFIALGNYSQLNTANRAAMDRITKEVRQAKKLTSYATNSITLEDFDGKSLRYTHDPGTRRLTRVKDGVTTVLLTECDFLEFTIAQRNPVGGAYDVYPVATAGTAKVINLSWRCSRTILGVKSNTENVQTARIVIRKQGK